MTANLKAKTCKVINLRVENLQNPIGLDIKNPRFSWMIDSNEFNQVQTAYQIIVSSSAELIKENQADIWNSGKVISDQSNNIMFSGKALKSMKCYFYQVIIWGKDNDESDYSEIAIFETAFLDQDEWKVKWIAGSKPNENVVAYGKAIGIMLPPPKVSDESLPVFAKPFG